METRTLLTIVALLLAGMVTIMLARGDDNVEENVFNSNTAAMTQMQNAVAQRAGRQSDEKRGHFSNGADFSNDSSDTDLNNESGTRR